MRAFAAYRAAHPELAAEFERRSTGELPAQFAATRDAFIRAQAAKGETIATRKASQQAIEAFAALLPEMLGGSADLTGSVFTNWSGSHALTRDARRQLRQLRRARIRDGGHRQRHRAARRPDSLFRDVPHVFRLLAQRAAHGGADEAAQRLRVHARFDRPRRGRPDAPVGRAHGDAAPHSRYGRLAAVRHRRDGRRMARGAAASRRPELPRAVARRTSRSRRATPRN